MAGHETGAIHTVRDLAGKSGISMPMASKILKPLARSGIIESQRGVKGGYRLVREASRISVAEVLEILEGPLGITTCVSNPGSCERETVCPTKGNWEKINNTVRNALKKVFLSDMAATDDPVRTGGDELHAGGTFHIHATAPAEQGDHQR
jgi:Rrf2 family protein